MSVHSRCPGFASYEGLADGSTLVNGQLPTLALDNKDIKHIHDHYHSYIVSAAHKHRIPVVWMYGIIFAEASRKDWDRSCSPCTADCAGGCQNNPICPTLGAPACAYGLMQTIPATARAAGITNAATLVGNPALSIDLGALWLAKLAKRFPLDLPGVAASYLGGGPSCRGGGVFGFGTVESGDQYDRDGYAYRVTRAANTAFKLGYGTESAGGGASSGKLAGVALLAAAAVMGGMLWMRKKS
jgi:hypothetical protein